MRIAALYDVHGNLPALEAALGAARRESVDEIVVGGDVVPGPMAVECLVALETFEAAPVAFLSGNGERETGDAARGVVSPRLPGEVHEILRWTASRLDRESLARIAAWPTLVRREIQGLGRVLFCHATPDSDEVIVTRRTSPDDLRSHFAGRDAELVVCGHTHMAFDLELEASEAGPGVRVVNAGSVGMPFGPPGAYWALLTPTGVELRRSAYDLEAAAERVRSTDFPHADAFADANLLSPPGEEEMLDLYSPV